MRNNSTSCYLIVATLRCVIYYTPIAANQGWITEEQEMNKYIVTLENFDGRCKRITVFARSEWDAMAATQKGGWHPVEVKAA